MTEQTQTEAGTETQEETVFERIARQDREHRQKMAAIDRAWKSPEAEKIRHIVVSDANVSWREFVSHVGGILDVVQMVDVHGLPDTDRIIPAVDSLFDTYVQKEIQAGSVFRRHPGNRPYKPGPGTSAGEARAAAARAGGGELGPAAAERMLREEAEAEQQRAAWSRGR